MKRAIIFAVLIAGAALIYTSRPHAATITATSCSLSAVQTAVNTAQAGDIVQIPAGTCSWTAPLSWTAPANVVLLGAGDLNTTGGGDQTVIIDDYASGSPLVTIGTNTSGSIRIAGITFRSGTGGQKYGGVVVFAGQSAQFRMDHVHFNMTTGSAGNGAAVRFYGWVRGVIDHSIFDLNGVGNGIQVWYDGYGGGNENAAWAAATGFGTSDFLYVEDNTFTSNFAFGSVNDCLQSGKMVYRYNTIDTSMVQTHATVGDLRGCRALEVYRNTFTGSNGDPAVNALYLTSGTGLFWSNTAATGYVHFMSLHSTRSDNTSYPETATPNGWGYCGTAFNGTGSNWDQNSNASTGYACLDMLGRGVGQLISGYFPNKVNSVTGTIAWPNQALEPVYEWLTSWTTAGGGVKVANSHPTVINANRDYYVYDAGFTGATGTGSGTLAARPATCTTGVFYFATDQGNWNSAGPDGLGYKCTSTNTWTLLYTPYTYPHPLVSTPSGSVPTAPTNIRLQ